MIHLTRPGSSVSDSVLEFPAWLPLGVSWPLRAASLAWTLSAGGNLQDLGEALAEHVALSRTKTLCPMRAGGGASRLRRWGLDAGKLQDRKIPEPTCPELS